MRGAGLIFAGEVRLGTCSGWGPLPPPAAVTARPVKGDPPRRAPVHRPAPTSALATTRGLKLRPSALRQWSGASIAEGPLARLSGRLRIEESRRGGTVAFEYADPLLDGSDGSDLGPRDPRGRTVHLYPSSAGSAQALDARPPSLLRMRIWSAVSGRTPPASPSRGPPARIRPTARSAQETAVERRSAAPCRRAAAAARDLDPAARRGLAQFGDGRRRSRTGQDAAGQAAGCCHSGSYAGRDPVRALGGVLPPSTLFQLRRRARRGHRTPPGPLDDGPAACAPSPSASAAGAPSIGIAGYPGTFVPPSQ
eukprot:tig00021758_g23400.t1